jgi:hypothetical protein
MRFFASMVVVLVAAPVFADALVQQLPKAGMGQKYHVNLTIDGREEIQVWIAQSVGRKDVDGKPARWIELIGGPKDFPIIFKVLVHEHEFGKGKNPLSKAIETWQKRGMDKPKKITSIKNADLYFWLLLSGPSGKSVTLKEKHTINWQGGAFECDIQTGVTKFDVGFGAISISHRVYWHKDSPFGLCGGKQEYVGKFGDRERRAEVEYVLTDLIKNAKPILPGVK